MKRQSILLFLSAALLFCFVSCDSDDAKDIYIPIKSVRVTTSTSLDGRDNWEFYVNNNIYKKTVNSRTIHAQPKSEEEITCFIVYADNGNKSAANKNKTNTVLMSFVSPSYHLKQNVLPKLGAGNGSATAELLDQSTFDKMITVDAISAYHTNMVTSHVDNMKLVHNHCLINYTFEGLPEGAQTQLRTASVAIQPFVEDGVHKAILVNPQLASVQVKVGEAIYELPLKLYINKLATEMRLSKDICYNFVVKYDGELETNKAIKIENMTAQKWSEQEQEELELKE